MKLCPRSASSCPTAPPSHWLSDFFEGCAREFSSIHLLKSPPFLNFAVTHPLWHAARGYASDPMEHAHKSVTVQGIVKTLKAHGWLEGVRAKLNSKALHALDDPMSSKFHDGRYLDEVYDVLAANEGPDAVDTLLYESTRDSMSGIAGPLAKLFLTTIGATPRTLFSRFETLLSSGTRGFHVGWEDTGPRSGRLSISTQNPAPLVGDYAWRGVIRYLFEFAGAKGAKTVTLPRLDENRTARFDLSWE